MLAASRFGLSGAGPFGDRARWPEIFRLNGLKNGKSRAIGDCFLLPPLKTE